MSDKKENTGFWQSWMTIAVLLALTIMVLLFNSQSSSLRPGGNGTNIIGNGTNIIGNGTNIIGNGTNIIGNGTNISIIDNDTYFKNSVLVDIGVITENLNCISESGNNRNFTTTERCGKFLRDDSNNSLRHVSEYNVSPSLQVVLEHYKKALEYYNIGGIKLEMGARNRNASQMSNAIDYIQNGTVYLNRALDILDILSGNDTSNTKFGQSKKNVSNK